MTMQMRYTIGIHLAERLFQMPEHPGHFELPNDDAALKAKCERGRAVDARWKPYWAGSGRGNTWVGTWGCNLPRSIGHVFQIRSFLYELWDEPAWAGSSGHLIRKGARTLSDKLTLSLGLVHPLPNVLTEPEHFGLVASIVTNPHERANWLVYADWLEEYGDAAARIRCRVIRGIFAKKAMTMRYGIPILARLGEEPNLERNLKEGV